MWFLALPDILVFFSIFFGGVLTGILSVLLITFIYCSGGGTIRIQYTEEDKIIKQEDF